jgi:hypothetical protein
MGDNSFVFSKDKQTTCTIVIGTQEDTEDLYAASLLSSAIEDIVHLRPPIMTFGQEDNRMNRVLIGSPYTNPGVQTLLSVNNILGMPEEIRAEIANRQILVPQDLGEQGFIIYLTQEADRRSLVVSGNTSQGVLYGVYTLINRLFLRKSELMVDWLGTRILPIIHHSPFETRSIFTNISGPDWLAKPGQWSKEWRAANGEGYDYKGFIDWVASHKINHLLLALFDLDFGIAYPSKIFPELVNSYHPNVKHEFMGELIEYAHKRHIKIFFHADFPDLWTSVVRAYPELAGVNVDKSKIMDDDTWHMYQQTAIGNKESRFGASWVCGSKPEVFEIWRRYWQELIDRYPEVDGVGGQPCEHPETRCNCDECSRTFFDQEKKFFTEVFRIGKAKNPKIQPWIFRVWGGLQMLESSDADISPIVIDWWARFPLFMTHRYLPRSDWYLFHCMHSEWPEFGFKQVSMAFPKYGVKAYQIRGVKYRETDHLYQAYEEFAWDPDLSVDDYAFLYILKRFRREDSELANAYAHWIKATGYAEILADPDVPRAWLERENYQAKLLAEIEQLSPRLEELGVPSGFIASARDLANNKAFTLNDLAWNWRSIPRN